MLKSIMWFLMIGVMVYTLEIFSIVAYLLYRYKMDFRRCEKWADVFGEIHDEPWRRLGNKLSLSEQFTDRIETIAHMVTWPYAACVVIYSTVLTTREFEQRLKKES